MRQDKLTTKFQEALGNAQSLALGNDNACAKSVRTRPLVLPKHGREHGGFWPKATIRVETDPTQSPAQFSFSLADGRRVTAPVRAHEGATA